MRYKPIEYISNMPKAIKNVALTGIAALVIAASAGGCSTAASRGGTFKLFQFEYGSKSTKSKDPEVQKRVIDADAKYEDSATVVPGKGFGLRYKED